MLTVTLVTMFGWTLLIFSNGPGVIRVLFETGSLNEFLNLVSQAHPVAYGFFGAYLFVIGMMIRRYHRSDLSPSIFMSAVYQIWAAGMVDVKTRFDSRFRSATVCWASIRNRGYILYPGVGTFVLIRLAQTFYERIMVDSFVKTRFEELPAI